MELVELALLFIFSLAWQFGVICLVAWAISAAFALPFWPVVAVISAAVVLIRLINS